MQPNILRILPPEPGPQPEPIPSPRPEPERQREVSLPLPSVFVPPSWGYRHVTRPLTELATLETAELDRLGAEGWELAAIVNDGQVVHFYFKRLLR